MKRIIITAILAAICTVGGATSFVMNDLPSYTAWKQDNAQQFKNTSKHDGIDQQKDKHFNNDKDHKNVKDYKNQKDHKEHRDYDHEIDNMPTSNTPNQPQGQMPAMGSVPVSEQPAQPGTQPANGATQAPNIQSSADQSGQ